MTTDDNSDGAAKALETVAQAAPPAEPEELLKTLTEFLDGTAPGVSETVTAVECFRRDGPNLYLL